jgi:hypothetical protein
MSPQSTREGSGSSPRKSELAEQLRQARIYCGSFDYFVPVDELERLITASVIKREIQDMYPTMRAADAQTYADKIEESAKKLFAILALKQNGAAIRLLFDCKISDQDLPFQKEIVRGQWSLWRGKPAQRIEAFDQWENEKVEEFARAQWWMIAPVFDKRSLDCIDLADEDILPFIPIEEHEKKDDGVPHMKVGGYSEVTAYRIHPAHHNFWARDKTLQLVRNLMINLKSFLLMACRNVSLLLLTKSFSPTIGSNF